MDRLEEWQVFVAVAGRRSFSAAARSLARSPQAVTRAVASLEARLGTRLLHRTTRSVSLTGDGERYLERARRAVAEVEQLEARPETELPFAGRLTVTAPVLFGQLHVMPVALAFLRVHAGIALKVSLLDRVVSLADEGVDVAVRIGALPDSALRARLVGHVRSVVCASPAYLRRTGEPRTLEALAEHDAIAFTGMSPIADRWAFPGPRGRERSVAVRPRLIVDQGQAALDAAVAGMGVLRALSYQVDRLVAQGKLRTVLTQHEPPPLPVHLVHLPGLQARAAVTFAEHAAKSLAARLTGKSASTPRGSAAASGSPRRTHPAARR